MILLETYYSTGLFFIGLFLGLIALLYTYGGQIIKDRFSEAREIQDKVTSTQVSDYFKEQGYVVCHIASVKNSHRWIVLLIKNGEYQVVTAFTNGETIQGYQHSLN
jgi:hypothetical protein